MPWALWISVQNVLAYWREIKTGSWRGSVALELHGFVIAICPSGDGFRAGVQVGTGKKDILKIKCCGYS